MNMARKLPIVNWQKKNQPKKNNQKKKNKEKREGKVLIFPLQLH